MRSLPADYDPAEENPGAQPFSEPEASLLLSAATAFRPHVWWVGRGRVRFRGDFSRVVRQYSLIFHCSHCLTVPSPPAALLYCCTAVLLYRRANVHSGMSAMFMPYDHKGHIPGALPPCCAVHAVLCILSCVRCACCAVVRCAVLGLVHVRTGGCGHTRCVCMRASWLQPAPPPPRQPPPPLTAPPRISQRATTPWPPCPSCASSTR